MDQPVATERLSTDEMEARLGAAVRRTRIAAGYSQAELALAANVAVSSVSALEGGRGSSTATLTRVVRALGRIDWLDALAPPITISPIALANRRPAERRRVARDRGER
jgi:transcriptional regulator with XRE-family HTH domain